MYYSSVSYIHIISSKGMIITLLNLTSKIRAGKRRLGQGKQKVVVVATVKVLHLGLFLIIQPGRRMQTSRGVCWSYPLKERRDFESG